MQNGTGVIETSTTTANGGPNNKPRRHSKPNDLKAAASGEGGRSGSAGGGLSSERVIESLHSTLSSSASLDDLTTASEPIISHSATGGVHKRHEQLKNDESTDNQRRRISVSKETNPDEEKKNS